MTWMLDNLNVIYSFHFPIATFLKCFLSPQNTSVWPWDATAVKALLKTCPSLLAPRGKKLSFAVATLPLCFTSKKQVSYLPPAFESSTKASNAKGTLLIHQREVVEVGGGALKAVLDHWTDSVWSMKDRRREREREAGGGREVTG